MNLRKKLFFLMLLPTVYSLTAQETKNDTLSLKEVVITGTPVKVNKNCVPMAVTVVTREQIDESNEFSVLPILNGRVPGLFVTERGITGFGVATGAAGQITMRGIGGSPTTGVLMLIDGHPQFMGIFGHPLADSYVATDVERVEVVRGPSSILYGSNAMGGVINIITRKQDDEGTHLSFNLLAGSYNTQKYAITIGNKNKKFSTFTSFNYDCTDGHRPNANFNIINGYQKITYQINPHLLMTGDVSLAGFHSQDPGPDTLHAQPGVKMNILRGYGALTLENTFEKFSGSAKVYYNFGEHRMTDGFHSTDANFGFNISESVQLIQGNRFTFGGDYANYGGKAETELGEGQYFTMIDTTVYELGVYGFMQQTLAGRLVLNAGIRLQHNKVFGEAWIPSGGFSFLIRESLTWKANVSKGFRSPTIRELFMWNHNTELNPETIMNYETGVQQSLFSQKLNLELTFFLVKGQNLIVAGEMGKLFNTGEVDNKGIEFAANFILDKALQIDFTYSYINMKTPVFATPESHLYAGIHYTYKKLHLTAELQQVNCLNTEPNPTKTAQFQDYTLINAKISYQVLSYAQLFVSGDNLLNQKYENLVYYPMPGSTFFGGVQLKF
ncbi:MAG: TonB-dependent receptor [Bacteroidales bacterium]|jgi:iron complex outermembrane receptor protein